MYSAKFWLQKRKLVSKSLNFRLFRFCKSRTGDLARFARNPNDPFQDKQTARSSKMNTDPLFYRFSFQQNQYFWFLGSNLKSSPSKRDGLSLLKLWAQILEQPHDTEQKPMNQMNKLTFLFIKPIVSVKKHAATKKNGAKKEKNQVFFRLSMGFSSQNPREVTACLGIR